MLSSRNLRGHEANQWRTLALSAILTATWLAVMLYRATHHIIGSQP